MKSSMKAISLWQPWASLVIDGHKRIETRSWPVPRAMRGKRILIHAAKLNRYDSLIAQPPFDVIDYELPHGAILGTVKIKECLPTSKLDLSRLSSQELAFGDFSPRRYAWLLVDPRPLHEPLPWRGSQGFFSVPGGTIRTSLVA